MNDDLLDNVSKLSME